jgi:hypothetical protein
MRQSSKRHFGLKNFVGAAIVGLVVPATSSGCIFFSNFDGLEGGKDAGAQGSGGASSTSASSGGGNVNAKCITLQSDPCDGIQPAKAGFVQIIDGNPEEFCGYSFLDFQQTSGVFASSCANHLPEAGVTADVHAKVYSLWSPEGLHFHIHVSKNGPLIAGPPEMAYHGDAIELLVASRQMPSGGFVASEQHVIVGLDGSGKLNVAGGSVAPADIALVQHEDDYDVELRFRWADIGGQPTWSPPTILFDLIVDTGLEGDPSFLSTALSYKFDGKTVFCKNEMMDGKSFPQIGSNDAVWCPAALRTE